MENLPELIKKKKWVQIFQKYHPKEIAKILSFKEGMYLAYDALLNEQMDEDLREHATSLIDEIRKFYPEEWDNDWRNEIFLGDAFYLIMRHKERFESYKRAYDKIASPPPALLVSLAGCYLAPNSPISMENAEKFILKSLENEKSIEAVTLIRGICKTKGKIAQFSYWDRVLHNLESKNAYLKNKWPQFLEMHD